MRNKVTISKAAHRTTRLLALCVTTWAVLPGSIPPAQAAFYKCVGADGSTTYNDAPCAADESTHRLSKSARRLNGLDCRIAQNFAYDAVARMRQNDSAIDVFQAYGGASDLTESARTLINYVYTFESDRLTSAQRIVDLATERCQAGLLGKRLDKCEAFPSDFIDRFGSCVKARQTDQTILIQSQGASSQDQSTGQSNSPTQADKSLSSNNASDEYDQSEPALRAAKPLNKDKLEREQFDDKPVSDDDVRGNPQSYQGRELRSE